jgi:hypothetical protein
MDKRILGLILASIVVTNLPLNYMINGQSMENDEENVMGTVFDLSVTIATGVMSLILLFISLIAYRHQARGRLMFVMGAFFLFALKSVSIALNDVFNIGLIAGQLAEQIQPISSLFTPFSRILDLGILLLFFFALVIKE